MSRDPVPAVAGRFYPAAAEDLAREVQGYLAQAESTPRPVKALIVPHAGFVYSGPVAASGYRCLEPRRASIRRVVLVGPAHRALYHGIATSGADAFVTPLGRVAVDPEGRELAESLPSVLRHDTAHAPEHSLEVHLPFLQIVLDEFSIVPLLVGETSPRAVADVLDALWGGDETLLVISSDLSHYHEYAVARALDAATSEAIEAFDTQGMLKGCACGHLPIKGLLRLAARRGLTVTRLDLRSSGDTAGPRDRVVGYGAWAFGARGEPGATRA